MTLLLKYKRILALFVVVQVSCFSDPHTSSEKEIPVSALQNDFDILRKTLEEAHPGLYWYTDKNAMDSFFNNSKDFIDHDMTRIEFFNLLLPVIANIRCAHTNLQLPADTSAPVRQFSRLLPFNFYYENGRLYIAKALHGGGHEGSEIISVNGISTKDIIENILSSLPADGYNQTYKLSLLNKGAFREGYALLIDQPEVFTIQTRNGKQLSSFTAKAISPHEIFYAPEVPLPAFSIRFRQSIAVLSVNTFQMNKKRFHDSVSNLFQTIQYNEVKRLIIDLRHNGGGINDNVSQLYSFLAASPFLHLKKAEMKAKALTYPQFISGSTSFATSSKDTDKETTYSVSDRYAGTKVHNLSPDNLFTGQVVLLTCGNTTSAASEFVAIARFLKRATIVGEETGGCYYGATGGDYLTLTLPRSGLKVNIPTVRILTAVEEDFNRQPKGRGTLPDYQIQPTLSDIIKGKDVQLEAAIQLLSSR